MVMMENSGDLGLSATCIKKIPGKSCCLPQPRSNTFGFKEKKKKKKRKEKKRKERNLIPFGYGRSAQTWFILT
ncbi:hypothetical protein VN97_g9668 [Penicillium thymicola]|uniref:Uncharacterized protein n=1 Tax=Penicillium thymicola TaxID=293382 RepID=A0AAI9TAI5_PENTH|nr:hypothetical protein VN97_g9668 [Penicillium thymicola]